MTEELIELDRALGLRCALGGFHVDPWAPVPLAVLTHAHGDHAPGGCGRYVCSPETAILLRRRAPDAQVQTLAPGQRMVLGDVALSLHPAGHVLGSSQVRLERGGEVWVVTGDFKRELDPTCAPFEPMRCDVLVTEATFALPVYRWPDPASELDSLAAFWDEAREANEPALVTCWALGKAQRLIAELAARRESPVHAHGAVLAWCEAYREAGVTLPDVRSATDAKKADLRGALVLAPPSARGTPWARRVAGARTAMASGWMRVRGERRRRSLDRGFVISDHADWPALLRTIEESGATRVRTMHGHGESLARWLREVRGIDACALGVPPRAEESV